jgi:hypothetical protein
MPRRAKFEHLKPEVFRLLAEGFKPQEILQQLPDIPQSTVYDWQKEFRYLSENGGNKRERLPIDPESPLDKIMNALWDVVNDPTTEGANTKVNALNALLRVEQVRVAQFVSLDFDGMDEEQLKKIAKNVP